VKKGFSHESQSAQSVEWYTPPWIFEALGLTFDLDPCSPPGGLPWVPVGRIYSLPQDGLTAPWAGSVWCNPPYGKETGAWLKRMHEHRSGVALVFARTDCAWFHDYVKHADAILFLRGRVKFVDGNEKTGRSGAGAGSMLVGWGDDACHGVRSLFRKHGGLLV
jgi:hypothetical protein